MATFSKTLQDTFAKPKLCYNNRGGGGGNTSQRQPSSSEHQNTQHSSTQECEASSKGVCSLHVSTCQKFGHKYKQINRVQKIYTHSFTHAASKHTATRYSQALLPAQTAMYNVSMCTREAVNDRRRRKRTVGSIVPP
eukprot:2004147-Amphidinium_carterae.1